MSRTFDDDLPARDDFGPQQRFSSEGDSSEEAPPPASRGCGGCGCGCLAILLILATGVALLPTMLSMPAVRGPLIAVVNDQSEISVSVADLSLGWLSPPVVRDLKAGPRGAEQPALAIKELSGDRGLLKLFFGGEWGTIRILQPAINLELERRPTGFGRLLGAEIPRNLILSPLRFEIIDASISVRGRDKPEPWKMEGLQIFVDLVPASMSPADVPMLRGRDTTLLNNAELTPEMCDDVLKFVAPVLASTTRSSGRVSLVLSEFTWPLGQPTKAELKGQLTLHEVSAGPGAVLQGVIAVLGLPDAPDAVRLAKENVVDFSMHDGRIYHENLAFGLAELPGDQLIRTRGSVGLDETLDLFIEFPPLGSRLLPEGPLRDALARQRIDLHVTGTLKQPIVKLPEGGGQLGPGLKALSDWLQERSQSQDGQRPRPLFPNRRRGDPLEPAGTK